MLDNLTVNVYFAPAELQSTLDIIVNQLRKLIMDQTQLADTLGAVSTALAGVGNQLTKATAEIVTAIAAGGVTSPAVDAAVASLQAVATALASASQALDDLNPDEVVAP